MKANHKQGPVEDKKSTAQKNNSGKENKAKETKPQLQEDNAIPGHKGPKGNGYNSPK